MKSSFNAGNAKCELVFYVKFGFPGWVRFGVCANTKCVAFPVLLRGYNAKDEYPSRNHYSSLLIVFGRAFSMFTGQ